MTAEDGNAAYRVSDVHKANGGPHNAGWWWAKDAQRWTALPAVQDNLDSAKSMLSASDPIMKRENDKKWAEMAGAGEITRHLHPPTGSKLCLLCWR